MLLNVPPCTGQPPAKRHPALNVSDTETEKPCSREEKAVQSHFPQDHTDPHSVRAQRDLQRQGPHGPTASGTSWTYSVRDLMDLRPIRV